MWNVAWVAHALTTNPSSLFDANIFYPHENTLAYSEANLVAGLIALPVWAMTGNPYASYNTVVLFAFAAAALSAFLLVRVLGGSRLGATIAGITYGFSPHMFSLVPHIQLLMTFGPALSMAAMHHFTKAPSARRGVLLGLALAVTGLACAYYGIFAGLMTGVGLVWNLVADRRYRDARFLSGLALAAAVVLIIVGPFFIPYFTIREGGFERSLDEARVHSTNFGTFLASAVVVHRWLLPLIGEHVDVFFPGFLAIALATVAMVKYFQGRDVPAVRLYATIGILAFWASLGPAGGLYTALYYVVPAFSFLRAPVRFGVLVLLAIAVLAGFGTMWLERHRSKAWPKLAAILIAIALLESYVGPLPLTAAPPLSTAHRRLATLPRAPVAEFPFYSGRFDRHRHTEYMLASTFHWQPLINGYSDYMPLDFFESATVLEKFPSAEGFELLRKKGVRWVVVHFDAYPPGEGPLVRQQLIGMTDRLRAAVDEYPVSLFEVIWPTPQSAARQP